MKFVHIRPKQGLVYYHHKSYKKAYMYKDLVNNPIYVSKSRTLLVIF